MFQSNKCGLCKVPQETQSPVTKLFRRLGCSDSSSETVNLVKVKKKKSTPASTQQKCDCTETGMQTSNSRNGKPAKNADDTFSFTSCSLKKLLASESPKLIMALIVAVGILTVILVVKCICYPAIISDITETRERRSNDAVNDVDRKPWEASKSRLMSEFSEFAGKDTRESNLHGMDTDYPEYLSPDLSSILDPIKVNEGYGSNSLRDFYRKLLKTDIQIKNLKKGFANTKRGNIDLNDPNARLKRSLKIFAGPKRHTETPSNRRIFNKYYPQSDEMKTSKDIGQNKEESNDLEKEKSITKEENFQHDQDAKDTGGNNMPFKLFQTEESGAPKNNMKPYNKYTQWLETIFGRESPATQHRRLLQHNDEEDNDPGATEDYEEQTKGASEREKRTTDLKALEVYVHTKSNVVPETKQPKSKISKVSNLKPSKALYDQEINFLIDAAMKMKSGKIDDMKHKESNPNHKQNKEDSKGDGNYNELVEMAQAYSDYGVLDNKKEIIENNVAPGNTNSIQSDKSQKTVDWFNNNIDNQHGQRIKLKSNGASKMETDTFLKKHGLNMFLKIFHYEIKNNNIESTKTSNTVDKISNSTFLIETTSSRSKSTPKNNQKHKERNALFSGYRRSLKSVETSETNDEIAPSNIDIEQYVNNTDQHKYNEENNLTYISDKIEGKYENATNKINKTIVSIAHEQNALKLMEDTYKHNNSTIWGLGDIFSMIADLCMFLAGFDADQEDNSYRFLYDFVTMLKPNYLKNKTLPGKVIKDTRPPMEASIDSERVENIGHRSRVLMSFEEPAENITSITYEKDANESYVVTSKKYKYV